MKQKLFLTIILFGSLNIMSQKLFKVIELKRSNIYGLQNKNIMDISYFRIVLNDDTLGIPPAYPLDFPKNIDTLKAIAELLKYEGDKRLCVLPINNYNLERSQIYLEKDKNYSMQLEALFIINQLVFQKPFDYASYPILVNKNTNQQYSVNSTIIPYAFKAYWSCYKKLQKKGINYIKEKGIMPLDGSTVRWY